MPNQPKQNTEEKSHFPKSKILRIASSAAIAFVLWFYVISVFRTEVELPFRNVQVEFEGASVLDDRGLKLISDTDLEVDLTLNGQRSVLNSLRSSDLTVRVDLTRIYEAGTRGLTYEIVYPGDVASSDIEVVSRTPDTIKVTVVSWAEKRVNVKEPVVTGTPEEGFRLGIIDSEDWSPKTVRIAGPKEIIERIQYAGVVVDVQGATESKEIRKSFIYYDADGNVLEDVDAIQSNPENAQVKVPILMESAVNLRLPLKVDKDVTDMEFLLTATVTLADGTRKEFSGTLFHSEAGFTSEDKVFGGLDEGDVYLDLEQVIAFGPLLDMEYITEANLPELDLNGVVRKEYSAQDLDFAQDGIGCELQSIVVTVETRAMQTRDFKVTVQNENNAQFTVVRPPEGYYVVTLKGFEEDLNQIKAEDIIVLMPENVTAAGSYPLEVMVPGHPEVEVLVVPYVTFRNPTGGSQYT